MSPTNKPLKYSEGASLPPHAPAWAVAASERLREAQQQQQQRLPPPGVSKILLHSCCAPCSGAMVEEMMSYPHCTVTVFFYNPNIHPKREYEIRKEENKRFCAELGIDFVDVDNEDNTGGDGISDGDDGYGANVWYERVKGMEWDPERGRRCTACFDLRMERTALYAVEHGFDALATTNATSRWKDAAQVNEAGFRAAARYPNRLVYWARDWQTDTMTLRKYQISAERKFYKQEYCGCSYSLRDSNEWRRANGIPKVQIGGEEAGLGQRYFTDPLLDAAEESQDVVDEFFAQAEEIAAAGTDRMERRKALSVYKDRRKDQKEAGIEFGLNNW